MVATFRLLRPLKAINSGPNSAETLHYYSNIWFEDLTVAFFLGCCAFCFCKVSHVFFVSAYVFFFFGFSSPSLPSSYMLFVPFFLLYFFFLYLFF